MSNTHAAVAAIFVSSSGVLLIDSVDGFGFPWGHCPDDDKTFSKGAAALIKGLGLEPIGVSEDLELKISKLPPFGCNKNGDGKRCKGHEWTVIIQRCRPKQFESGKLHWFGSRETQEMFVRSLLVLNGDITQQQFDDEPGFDFQSFTLWSNLNISPRYLFSISAKLWFEEHPKKVE